MATNTALEKVMRELAALEEPKMREANESRGDDHGVNLTQLRALSKATQDPARARTSALGHGRHRRPPSCHARVQTEGALGGRARRDDPRHPLAEAPRLVHREHGEARSPRRGAPLALERRRRPRRSRGLEPHDRESRQDAPKGSISKALLDQIEKEMKQAPAAKQWAMNHCLAEIGIHHASFAREPSRSASGSKCSSTTRRHRVARRRTRRYGSPRWFADATKPKRRDRPRRKQRPVDASRRRA